MRQLPPSPKLPPNQTRQPTPGERLDSNRASLVRRGCALRSAESRW